jgi:hypothetical protein
VTKSTRNPQHDWFVKAVVAAGLEVSIVGDVTKLWWRNPLNHNSLRLTSIGHVWFTKRSKFPSHQIDLVTGVTGKQMLQLERLFKEPYFIKSNKSIFLYGESDAIMLQLHAGNLGQYLDNLQM